MVGRPRHRRGRRLPSTPRILVVGKGAPERGGIATFIESVTECLRARGAHVDLLNIAPRRPRSGGRFSFANATSTVVDAARLAFAARRADVVHLNTAGAPGSTVVRAGVLCLAARAAGARVVVHVHGGRCVSWLGSPTRDALARAALRGADDVVAASRVVAARLATVLRRDVEVIANGVDVQLFTPGTAAHDAEPTILFVGGLTPRKGVLDLVEAGRQLRARGHAHRLVLAGGTSDDGAHVERAVRTAVGDDVAFVDPRPNREMPDLYRSASIFCLPSWWEAQPLSVLEAMACGLPVVATDVGDVASMVGSAGIVVEPRRPDLLADALAELLADPARCACTGADGRARVVETFDIEHVVTAVAATCEAVTR